jgi:hypothetical protein
VIAELTGDGSIREIHLNVRDVAIPEENTLHGVATTEAIRNRGRTLYNALFFEDGFNIAKRVTAFDCGELLIGKQSGRGIAPAQKEKQTNPYSKVRSCETRFPSPHESSSKLSRKT